MASHITHVVYGKKIFERLGGLSWEPFLIGTLFPDIRYLARVDRDRLHEFNTSDDAIPRNDSFRAGMYVHWLVDEKRERYILENKVYDLLPKEEYIHASLKLVEDELVYDKIDDWEAVINIFDRFPKEELGYGIDKNTVVHWHGLLKKYFRQKPNLSTWREMILEIGFDRKLAEKALNQVKIIKENSEIMGIIGATFNII